MLENHTSRLQNFLENYRNMTMWYWHMDRHIEIVIKFRVQKKSTLTFVIDWFDKVYKITQRGKILLFKQIAMEQLHIHMEKS